MPIKVGFYGVDDRSTQRYGTVFRMVYKGQCVPAELQDADIVIIELDHKNYKLEWETFRRKYPGKPVVVMADSPVKIDSYPFVSKPANLSELLSALKNTAPESDHNLNILSGNSSHAAATSLGHRIRGTPKVPSGADNASRYVEIYYRPENFLQGRVTDAIYKANTSKKNVFVKCWSDRWIIVCPGIECLYENIKEEMLKTLGPVEVIDSNLAFYNETLGDAQVSAMTGTSIGEIKSTPIYQFIWELAVRTAKGRIPAGTSLDEKYVLLRWPNLPRLVDIRNSMRISAFWVDKPNSIRDVIEKLGVPAEDVYTFFSAAKAIGIMLQAKSGDINPENTDNDVPEKKMKSIFSLLMKKIKGKTRIEGTAA